MKTAFQVLGLFACLATALSVVAEESPCAESYRKASAVYSKRLSELQKKQSNSEINTAGGAGATVIGCGLLLLKRNVAMFATCVGLGASATTIAYASGSGLDEEIAKLEIDHLIYESYDAYKLGEVEFSPQAKKLGAQLELDKRELDEALGVLAEAMDSGELCDHSTVRASLDQIKKLLEQETNG